MGKSLRGKECGKGICQRKAGLYYARLGLSCAILSLSTGEQENLLKTVPTIHIYINCVMKLVLSVFVCTPYDTLMLHARLNAAYNLKFYSNY